jgi:hypothetical protein
VIRSASFLLRFFILQKGALNILEEPGAKVGKSIFISDITRVEPNTFMDKIQDDGLLQDFGYSVTVITQGEVMLYWLKSEQERAIFCSTIKKLMRPQQQS